MSSHTLLSMWLLLHVGIKVNTYQSAPISKIAGGDKMKYMLGYQHISNCMVWRKWIVHNCFVIQTGYISPCDSSKEYISPVLGVVGIILGRRSANQRRSYIVTLALISWAYSQNDPCVITTADTWHTFNTLRPRRYGRHFADDAFKCFSWMKMYEFRSRFHWSLFLRFQLTIFQHWFR